MEAIKSKRVTASSRLRHFLYVVLGIFVGSVCLYLAARRVNFDDALAAIYAINWYWIAPLSVIFIGNILMRALRWRLMFPDESRPSVRFAIDAFLVGKIGNNFMPGRLGEVLRATVMGRLFPMVGFGGALATIVIEKIFDIVGVLILLGLALVLAPLPSWVARAGLLMVAAASIAIFSLWMLDRIDGATLRDTNRGGPLLIAKVRGVLLRLLAKFSTGLYALRTAKHAAMLSIFTLLIWFAEVFAMYICFQAFDIGAPFEAAVVAIVFLSLGTVLPSAPGFVGTYQLFVVAALNLYGVSDSSAFALSIFLNLYVIVVSSFLGFVAVAYAGGLVDIKQVFSAARKAV